MPHSAAALSVFKGDNVTIQVSIVDENGVAIDTAGWTINFTVRENDGSAATIITKSSTVGTEITGPTGAGPHIWNILLLPADLPQTLVAKNYIYDIQGTTDDIPVKIHTVIKDTFTVKQDVTHA